MKIYRILKNFFFILFSATMLFSCNDFLDEGLPDQYEVGKYYKDDEQAAKALYGTYAAVKSAVFGSDLISVTDAMTDDMNFRGTDQARRSLSSLYFDTRNKYFVNVWSKFYNVIGNANLLIDKVPKMEALTEESETNQKIILAEAKFIRAWSYFNLVQLWGEVPIVSQPVYSIKEDIRPSKSSIDSIYSFILKDLNDAEVLGDFPYKAVVRPGTDISYQFVLTKGAVRLLKAKTYLAMKKYPECLLAAQYIIDRYEDDGSKMYTLIDYSKIFSVLYKNDADRKKEVIWEIEALAQTGYNNTAHREFAPRSAISDCKTTGYQNYVPSTSLFEAFCKQPNDKRLAANYRISDGRPCIFKRVDVETSDQNVGGPNEILMRVSDAILVYAEALNATGETEEAIKWVNKVRNRAGLISKIGPVTMGDIKLNTPANIVQDTILFERRLEFAHEGQRLYDLRRTGKLMNSINRYNTDEARYLRVKTMTFSVPKEVSGSSATSVTLTVPFAEITKNTSERILLHPIPTEEIQSNPNLKPNNNGYN